MERPSVCFLVFYDSIVFIIFNLDLSRPNQIYSYIKNIPMQKRDMIMRSIANRLDWKMTAFTAKILV